MSVVGFNSRPPLHKCCRHSCQQRTNPSRLFRTSNNNGLTASNFPWHSFCIPSAIVRNYSHKLETGYKNTFYPRGKWSYKRFIIICTPYSGQNAWFGSGEEPSYIRSSYIRFPVYLHPCTHLTKLPHYLTNKRSLYVLNGWINQGNSASFIRYIQQAS